MHPKTSTMKGKRFTPEEDALIKELVEVKHITPWAAVAKYLPGRTGTQCRDRYNTYLYCEISTKNWTAKEDKIILEKYKEFGPKWVAISHFLPGRNGNSIKNRWNKALTKYHGIQHKDQKFERRSKKKSNFVNQDELYSSSDESSDDVVVSNQMLDQIFNSIGAELEFSQIFGGHIDADILF